MLNAIKCLRIPCFSLDKSPSTSVGTAGSTSIVVVLSSEFGADCSGGRLVSTFNSSSMAILEQDHVNHFLVLGLEIGSDNAGWHSTSQILGSRLNAVYMAYTL